MINAGNNSAGRWEPYGSGGTKDSLLSCGESARWWQENRRSEEENTPNTPPFSSWKKKTEDINLIGLSRRGERTSPLIGCGRTKQTQDMFSLAGPHCAFSPVSHHWKCVLLLQNVMLYSCHIVSCTKADGTLKTWKAVPTRLEDTARASLFACF